jgi:hypothetical protein
MLRRMNDPGLAEAAKQNGAMISAESMRSGDGLKCMRSWLKGTLFAYET